MNRMEADDASALPKRRHLQRLETIFEKWRAPLFYLTVCVRHRRQVLCSHGIYDILVGAWERSLTT